MADTHHPWAGPRHRSWLSNTVISGAALMVLLILTVVIDALNGSDPPPTYLTGLLGVAAGAFFGAVGSDKGKREAELEKTAEKAEKSAEQAKSRALDSSETAMRAELKADIIAEIAAMNHPDQAGRLPKPTIPSRLRGKLDPKLYEDDEPYETDDPTEEEGRGSE